MDGEISKAASALGKKSAEVNKRKGSQYFKDLVNKRWAQSIKCAVCGKRIAKSESSTHFHPVEVKSDNI